jgi:hypothetical protein
MKPDLHPPVKGKQPSEFLHMTFSAGKAQFKEDMLQHLIGAFQCLEDLPEKKSHRNNHIVAYTIEHQKCSTIIHQKTNLSQTQIPHPKTNTLHH